jgi:signal peptidase I
VSVPETEGGERRRDVQRRREAERQQESDRQRDLRRGGGVQHRGNGQSRGEDQGRRDVRHRRDNQHRRPVVTPMLRESVIVIGLALVLSLIVKTWLMQAFYIPSESMENTLLKGDRVIVNKLVPSPIAVRRGDVIVFQDPDHWLPPVQPVQRTPVGSALNSTLTFVGLLPSDEGNHLIKRVIGLPGDHVVCCDAKRRLTVNGVALTEPYLYPGDVPSQETFDITVPAARVWVMGDHRSDSADSRPHDQGSGGAKGTVPESLIVGRAIAVVWPFQHWAALSNPAETFSHVPTATAR